MFEKVMKSAAERNPAWVADEVAMVKVQVAEEEAMVRPVVPEVANAPANQIVLSAERSPPPASAAPALTARDDETALMPRVIVLSAERSPPPKSGAVVLMARVLETAVMPKEKVAVFAL